MKLYATPLSHFSRKVRILLDLYSLPYEFLDIGNVAEGERKKFGNNPLLRVPVLLDEENWVIESDHISSYLVQKYDPIDKYQVQTKNILDLNMRAIMNGIMSEEVCVILARRTSVPTEKYPFFDKALQAITNGLSWLEENNNYFDIELPKYREMHLVCLWDHLAYYAIVPMEYPKLRGIVAKVSENPLIKKSAPQSVRPK